MTDTIDKLTGAKDKFKSGDLAIGQNPTLFNQTLTITPNKWLIPVAKSAKSIREQLEVVRTIPLTDFNLQTCKSQLDSHFYIQLLLTTCLLSVSEVLDGFLHSDLLHMTS